MLREEAAFHEAFTAHAIVLDGDICRGIACKDISDQQRLAEAFATAANNLYVNSEELIHREQLMMQQRTYSSGRAATHLQMLTKKSSSLRAERDLWSLLAILTRSDLLQDIPTESLTSQSFNFLSPNASIKEVITAAYASSASIRKGRVLKEWIETAAYDRVTEIAPPIGPPHKATLSRILKHKSTEIKSLHPDAQLTKSGALLPFDTADNLEQESLLKCIWQLVRCGLITRAQEIAMEHGMYYLAASLLGVGHENHDEGMRVGNSRRALWQQSCVRYSTHLAANRLNWSSSTAIAVLEMSIYAALSNNVAVLSRSPLVATWTDKLWMLLKAAHERDIDLVLHSHNAGRHAHSQMFAYSTAEALITESAIVDEQTRALEGLDMGSCEGLFARLPLLDIASEDDSTLGFSSPVSTLQAQHALEPTENLLLLLQASVIQGVTALRRFIQQVLLPAINSSRVSKHLTRVYAHLILWIHLACPQQSCLHDLVDEYTLNTVLGVYLDQLMSERLIETVATYASFIDRPLRIHKYILWLNTLPAHSLLASEQHQSDSVFILASAKKFFKGDILEITRGTVETARSTADTRSLSMMSPPASAVSAFTPLKALPASTPISARYNANALVLSSPPLSSMPPPDRDEADVSRVETLRWLSIDRDHRNELVRQINHFIIQFMLESEGGKMSIVGALLHEHLPKDAVEMGTQNLSIRHAAEEEFELRTLDRLDPLFLQNTLLRERESEAWQAEVVKLKAWQAVWSALGDVEKWRKAKEQLLRTKAALLGDSSVVRNSTGALCTSLEQAATVAIESLMNVLRCPSFAAGISAVWGASEEVSMWKLERLFAECFDGDFVGEDTSGGSEYDYEILKGYLDIFGDSGGLFAEIQSTCESFLAQDRTTEVFSFACRSVELLKTMNEERQAFSLMLNLVSLRYVEVCLDTADHLTSILLPQLKLYTVTIDVAARSDIERVVPWLLLAVQYAQVLTEEDPAMSLYKALDSEKTQVILAQINEAVTQLLFLQPSALM